MTVCCWRTGGWIAATAAGVIATTDSLDVGNWDCALGIAALATESLVILLAAWRMQPQRRVHDAEPVAPAGVAVGASADRAG